METEQFENLTGNNDVLDITAEEPLRLDTTELLSRDRTAGNEQMPARLTWTQVGNSNTNNCPHLSVRADTGVSLRQACDTSVYSNPANENSISALSPPAADCRIHFIELPDSPGFFEVSSPAVKHPVVLQYEVTSTLSNGISSNTDLTICLEP